MEDKKIKVFGLSSWAVNNRKTVFLIMMIIIIGGLGAYTSMPKENFPELQIPEIYVGIAKPGSSPAYMSEKIAEAIEKEVASIKYLDEINSNSIHGYVTLRIKFDFKMEAADALTKVKDAIDKARSKVDFPDLPVEPNVFELDPAQMPIMNVNLRGDNPTLLKETAEILEDRIEDLPEINEVDIRGVQEQEMRIEVDRLKAEAVNVTLDDIERAVSSEHQIISGGEILMDGWRKTIRIDGEFDNAAQLAEIIVKQDDLLPVHLKDVAEVYFGNADTTSYAREFGAPVVMLDVKKQAGENLLDASVKIEKILADAKEDKTISPSITVTISNDQSDKTRDMVSNLENSIIFGILLVVIVLLFFLGGRNAMFVGVAIPLSMFMSFLILSAMGVSLNVMVLFSLVLALGMLVDNGIVVVENVYRLMDEEGMEPFKAAIYGVSEVAWPIIASTATTLAAFIPLAIWPGMMGEFMKYLPITLMIVLGSSLFVALVINPVLTALYMKVGEETPKKKKNLIMAAVFLILGVLFVLGGVTAFGNFLAIVGITILVNMFLFVPGTKVFQNKFLPRLERGYKGFLTFALRGKNPIFFILGTIVLLVFSIGLTVAFQPKVLFFPENQPNMAHIYVSHPIGTDIKVTNQTVLEVEERVNEILEPYFADTLGVDKDARIIQSIITQVGEGATDPQDMSSMGSTPHKGKVTVSFAEFQYRDTIQTSNIVRLLQNELKGKFTAEIELSVDKNKDGPPLPPAINMEVTGKGDYKNVIIAATEIKNYLERKAVPGVDKLKLNVDATRPEIPIVVDRDKVRKLNSSTTAVGMAIRKALLGQDISTYTKDEETYDIVVRFKKEDRNNLDALLDQKLMFRNNKGKLLRIPIRSVIEEPEENISYTAVVRKDQVPMVVISSNTEEGYNANEIVEELKSHMDDYVAENKLPSSVNFKFTGQQDEQAKEMAFLSKALLIAVFLILLIIVTQFNSYSTPAIILFAVVLSLIGVFLGLVISGMSFVVIMTMIGIIALAGVVVNNAIVLIDYTNLLRVERREELGLTENEQLPFDEVVKATIKGGETRLRPVLLTAITTILGLIPLAVGLNIDFIGLLTEYDANIFIGGDNNIFFSPMSWTIIFGLTFATFLTLIIVPAMYLVFYVLKLRIYKLFKWKMRSNI